MIDYNKQKEVIEKLEITDNLTLSTSVTFDELQVYLEVDYMNGKFTVQKTFNNNYLGLEQLENTKKEFSSEDAAKAYFGL